MRYLLIGLLVALSACESSPFDPIDSDDPLIGAWDSTNNRGETSPEYGSVFTFDADGRYTFAFNYDQGHAKEGYWGRVDGGAIQCDPKCGFDQAVAPVRIDQRRNPPLIIVDGVVAQDGVWDWSWSARCPMSARASMARSSPPSSPAS